MDKALRDITVGEWKAICDQRTQARNSGDSEYACPGCPMNSVCAATPDEWELPEDTPTVSGDTPTPQLVKNKPRLAEVLGVDVGEKFRVKGEYESADICIDETGDIVMHGEGLYCLNDILDAINHPESIIRAPRMTEAELERCRVFSVKYLTRNGGKAVVHMWDKMPDVLEDDDGKCYIIGKSGAWDMGGVDWRLFPSVEPDGCICVEEVSGG